MTELEGDCGGLAAHQREDLAHSAESLGDQLAHVLSALELCKDRAQCPLVDSVDVDGHLSVLVELYLALSY